MRVVLFLALFLNAGLSYGQTVPYWETLQNSAVKGAAWCSTKDNNKPIHKKSMSPPSTCLQMISKWVVVGLVTEHDLGKLAIRLACVGDMGSAVQGLASSLLSLTIPSGDDGALAALAICQCHNPGAIADLYAQRELVLSSLRQWGGCGTGGGAGQQANTYCHFNGNRYGPMIPPGQIGAPCPLKNPDGSLFGTGVVGY